MICRRQTMKVIIFAFFVVASFSRFSLPSFAQDDYLVGEQDQRLQMIVHVIGEVKKPGEYRVHDGTNILELFSKAGGPTEFSKLGKVTISRVQHEVATTGVNGNGRLRAGNQIIRVNLDDYLKRNSTTSPPLLKPGDVVLVPRNGWSKWRNTAVIFRDASVIISLYLLYLRVND